MVSTRYHSHQRIADDEWYSELKGRLDEHALPGPIDTIAAGVVTRADSEGRRRTCLHKNCLLPQI
jgi:hypothetical protein